MQAIRLDHGTHITVYEGRDALPPYVDPIPAWLDGEDSYRPAAFRIDVLGATMGCIAVWPCGIEPRSAATDADAWTVEDLRGVLLACNRLHRCFGCGAEHEVLYPEDALWALGERHRHSSESGCPTCGAEFRTSRLGGLRINPYPPNVRVDPAGRECPDRGAGALRRPAEHASHQA
ncbi:hypothetical protein Sru01_67450 [Sphaerisporangium rufum]|uniref:Uncharacterized protein n=1 Tax=Sphaerisporangium rufum TaxID=1381558 RepID=A0A919V510_9ACTN|nr:hypothetical protein Sru01_67450 [Sphaerisporangium rufum]